MATENGCIALECTAKAVGPFYCEDHTEKVTEFIVGNRSKVVVDRVIRRLKRRRPSWLILDGRKLYIDSWGWVTEKTEDGSEERLGHIKNILYDRGYTHVKPGRSIEDHRPTTIRRKRG